jgi:bifunctional DNase/RNase
MLIEVKVGALIMDPNSSTPIVILKGIDDETILPIWVGAYEANAIALEVEKIVPQRPMTHDLIRNLITQVGYKVSEVIVTDIKNNTFFALIKLIDADGSIISIDARPSDAIALALRADCPIFVDEKVIELSSNSIETISKETNTEELPPEEWPDLIG